MLYIADLKRDGLLKIGVSEWWRHDKREAELRRELNAPSLSMVVRSHIPYGWGSDIDWEKRLLSSLRAFGGEFQFGFDDEANTELVKTSIGRAMRELNHMRSETEIDDAKDADQLGHDKEDWRFFNFICSREPKLEFDMKRHSWRIWGDLLQRQIFIHWLRGDVWAPMPDRFLG